MARLSPILGANPSHLIWSTRPCGSPGGAAASGGAAARGRGDGRRPGLPCGLCEHRLIPYRCYTPYSNGWLSVSLRTWQFFLGIGIHLFSEEPSFFLNVFFGITNEHNFSITYPRFRLQPCVVGCSCNRSLPREDAWRTANDAFW